MKNQLAISNIAWDYANNDSIFEILTQYNIKNIEISPSNFLNSKTPYLLSKEEINIKLHEIIKHNLNIVSLQSILFGYGDMNLFVNNSYNKEMFEIVKKSIDLASQVNAKNIVFGAPKNRIIDKNMDNQIAKEIAKEFFYLLAEYGKHSDVSIGIEANAKEYGCNFLTTTDEALDFIKSVNHKNLLLNYDLGTDIFNQHISKNLIHNIQYVNHIHVSYPYLDPIKQDSDYDHFHTTLLSIIHNTLYTKYISLEMKNPNNIKSLEKSIEFLIKTYGI